MWAWHLPPQTRPSPIYGPDRHLTLKGKVSLQSSITQDPPRGQAEHSCFRTVEGRKLEDLFLTPFLDMGGGGLKYLYSFINRPHSVILTESLLRDI